MVESAFDVGEEDEDMEEGVKENCGEPDIAPTNLVDERSLPGFDNSMTDSSLLEYDSPLERHFKCQARSPKKL